MGRVSGKVALISGGARGLGAAQARLLAREGARVVIGDILEKEGAALAGELGGDARFVRLDVTRARDWEEAVAVAVDEFGGLDVLVNNAGIANFGPIEDYTTEAWNAVIDTNLTGVFLGIKAAVGEIKKSATGSIINMSSTAGLQGYASLPGYTAADFGVRGLTKAVALDLARYNVRVNSVHPGAITTPMTELAVLTQDHVAMHRFGDAAEVASLILFLASDESSFCTGAEFVIDGGETAGLGHRTT